MLSNSKHKLLLQSGISFSMYGLFGVLAFLLFLRHAVLVFFGVNEIATLIFAATYAIGLLICLLTILVEPFRPLSIVGVVTILALYFLLLRNDNLESFQGTLSMVFSILFMILFKSTNVIYKAEKVYCFFVIAASVILLLGMFLPHNTRGELLLYYTENGNQSALLLLCYILNLYMVQLSFEQKIMKILCFALMLGLAYGCYLTNCRTVIIIVVLLAALTLIAQLSVKAIKIITYAVLIFSFLIPFYITTATTFFGTDLTLFGETLYTGREILWRNATAIIMQNLFKTHFGEIVPTIGMVHYGEGLNAHNAFLEMAWRYSMFVAVPFFLMLLHSIHNVIKTTSKRFLKIFLPFFCAVFIHMAFEASLLVGAVDYTLLILLPAVILLNKERVVKDGE